MAFDPMKNSTRTGARTSAGAVALVAACAARVGQHGGDRVG
jgi:hypothetical protein